MNSIQTLSNILGKQLQQQQLTIATAESCTGGGIAQAITDVAGSSQWFTHGFVTYSNQAKQQLLNVKPQIIQCHGAVSQKVVEAMAMGALEASGASLAVAVSGIAGPDGGSPEKPVGTVWIAWQRYNMPPESQCFLFMGDRKSIRNQAVSESLKGVIERL